MQLMSDIITLRFFVAPYLMLLIYWLGAFIAPLMAGLVTVWLAGKARDNSIASAGISGVSRLMARLPHSRPLTFWLGGFFVMLFLLLELMWRVLFEFLIAIFHIHDALLEIASKA